MRACKHTTIAFARQTCHASRLRADLSLRSLSPLQHLQPDDSLGEPLRCGVVVSRC